MPRCGRGKGRDLNDRLGELLARETRLFGILVRDASLTDLELIQQAGYSVVWFDLEHGAASMADVLRLSRTAEHLGLVSLVRIPELSKSHLQPLLDSGVRIIVLPDVEGAAHAEAFARTARFPPLGHRGGSSAMAWSGYAGGDEVPGLLARAEAALHLMVQFESDPGFAELDAILAVPGIDMVTVGPLDWRLRAPGATDPSIPSKVEEVILRATKAGKVAAMLVGSAEEAARYSAAGLRIVFVGVDIALKRRMFREALERIRGGQPA